MAEVGIRQLSRETSRIIKEFEDNGEPVIITREGRPIGALVPVDQKQAEDLVLATAPEFRESARRAHEDVQARRSRTIEDVARERGVELPERRRAAGPGRHELVTNEPVFADQTLDREQVHEMAESALQPLSTFLIGPVFERISSKATDQIDRLSGEIVGQVAKAESAEPGEEHVRELKELTATAYSDLFRQHFLVAIRGASPDDAIDESLESAATDMRSLSREIVGSGSVSFDKYEASLRAVSLVVGRPEQSRRRLAQSLRARLRGTSSSA
jgi:prevent-host-death family protein